MRRAFHLLLTTLLLAAPAAWAAQSLGLQDEQDVILKGKVVDLACEVTGSCPADCGKGKRQLGLLTTDGKLIAVAKSFTQFAGGVKDLLPYCGKYAELDGLLLTSPKATMFQVQNVRPDEKTPWRTAENWGRDWAAEYKKDPDSDDVNNWFRFDRDVKVLIDRDGPYGIPALKK